MYEKVRVAYGRPPSRSCGGLGALRALLGAFGPLSLLPPKKNPKKPKKSKMAAMVPKWLPVIDMGVISLSSEFQLCSSSNG